MYKLAKIAMSSFVPYREVSFIRTNLYQKFHCTMMHSWFTQYKNRSNILQEYNYYKTKEQGIKEWQFGKRETV